MFHYMLSSGICYQSLVGYLYAHKANALYRTTFLHHDLFAKTPTSQNQLYSLYQSRRVESAPLVLLLVQVDAGALGTLMGRKGGK